MKTKLYALLMVVVLLFSVLPAPANAAPVRGVAEIGGTAVGAASGAPASATTANAAADTPTGEDLVLLRVAPGGSLQPLAGLALQVYAQFYAADGAALVLLPLDAIQQAHIQALGFALQVIEPHDLGKAESYTLVYGLEAELGRAAKLTPLLWQEPPQALVRIPTKETPSLTQAGVMLRPLFLRPLIIPQESIQAEELAPPQAQLVPAAPAYDDRIQAMINQVTQAKLTNGVGSLSGEWSVLVNGNPYTLLTRYTFAATPIAKATRYAYEKLQSLGLMTWYDYYYASGVQLRNVLAQQTGFTQPDRVFLLTAHLDSISQSPYTLAPGADDNASGSAALLAIADILRQYSFGCTLRYALFTGEEQGFYGSLAYAADPDPGYGVIQQVLNLDMLGYNTPYSSPTIELHTRLADSGDLAIAYLFKNTVSTYGLPLTPLILQDGKSFSDHSSFWAYGYPAIMAIEDWTDHTPYYHTTSDQLETLNMAYYTAFTKAALATFAQMGCLVETKPNYLPLVGTK